MFILCTDYFAGGLLTTFLLQIYRDGEQRFYIFLNFLRQVLNGILSPQHNYFLVKYGTVSSDIPNILLYLELYTLDFVFQVYELYHQVFPEQYEAYRPTGMFHCGTSLLQVGHSFLPIVNLGHADLSAAMEILHNSLEPLESLIKCVEMNWMAILVRDTMDIKL